MSQSPRETTNAGLATSLFSAFATITIALLLSLPAMMWTGCARSASADERPAVNVPADQQAVSVAPAARVKRGEYLVTIGGCNDCHTPLKEGPKGPEWDLSRMLSGHPESQPLEQEPTTSEGWDGMLAARTNTAFKGAWGTSFAMNLTPDTLTGIGNWTEEMFMKTIRTGKHWGVGRPIMPPMPWFNYAKMTDDDLKSVYSYLRSIPPVVNRPPAYREPVKPLASK